MVIVREAFLERVLAARFNAIEFVRHAALTQRNALCLHDGLHLAVQLMLDRRQVRRNVDEAQNLEQALGQLTDRD